MRQAKPWFRKSTKTWYVQLDGRQVPLGKDKEQANRKYHELMSGRRGGHTIHRVDELLDEYLEHVEALLASVQKYRLPQPVLRRIACAVAGFVSGYYSFAVIASQDEDIDQTFRSLRGAMVDSLARFIQTASPSVEAVPKNGDEKPSTSSTGGPAVGPCGAKLGG